MFDLENSKKKAKETSLESLIEHLMSMKESVDSDETEEITDPSELLGLKDSEKKPKVEIDIMKVEAKPKFKLSDGSEMEDESLEDVLKRKKKEA